MNAYRGLNRDKKRYLNVIIIFLATISFLAVITTVQLFILGQYIDYKKIPELHVALIICIWILCAAAFTYLTSMQIHRWYEKPIKDFAVATKKVANGDFSVYVEPLHNADNLDYVDYMFLNFNKMVEELGSIETLKTDFISNVSHELKTPLAVIQNYAEYLQMDDLSEKQRFEYAQIIEGQTKRLALLITNILRLNKLENQNMSLDFKAYDLCRQLSDCILQFEEIWEKKNIEVDATLEERMFVHADESLIELVWNNLLSNAFKFTEEGGRVEVIAMEEKDIISIAIKDNGSGMDTKTVKHIFDKFYQGDSSHAKEGNGLGLALTRRVIQLHGWSIKVESKLESGTVFTVLIPKYSEVSA